MRNNGILLEAVKDQNATAVKEILGRCTQEILEFRGAVSILCVLNFVFAVRGIRSLYIAVNKSKLLCS